MNHDVSLFEVPIAAPTSIKINGRDLREFGIELTGYPNALMPPIRERLQIIDGSSGSRDFGSVYDNWSFSITGQIRGLSHNDFVEKKTAFTRWIDMQQHRQTEWLVGQESIRTLKLELSGHKYFYTTGTITANATRTITGSSTQFKKFLKPNSEFRISGNVSTRYTIASIDSATQVTLSAATSVSGSGLSYEAERKRYLLVNYDGSSDISSLSTAHFRDRVFNFIIGFRTVYPYWIGGEFEDVTTAPSAGQFVELLGVGTAPCNPTYQIIGAATNPEICACEYAFVAQYDGDTKARTILNKADISASTSDQTYQPTRNDKGILSSNPKIAYYSAVPGYRNRFSFVVRFKTNFASNTAADKYLFNFLYDADNAFRLFYDASDYDWVLNVRSGGANNTTIRTTNTQSFASGDEIEVSGWYDVNGRNIEGTTYYGKIFVNGVEVGSATASITAPVSNPASLYIGSLTSADQAESIIDEVVLYVISLKDQDLISIYNDGEPLQNNNATISYTGTLDVSDILTIDTNSGESEFYDASAATETSPGSNLSGREPSLRGTEDDELAILYLPAAISGSLRVVFRPHFR